MTTRQAYLDYNATTPLRPDVMAAMVDAWREPGNASSVHGAGRRARARLDQARADVAHVLGALPEQVIFTGSGTEANDLALCGTKPARVIISAIEHDAVAKRAADMGAELVVLPVSTDGVVDLDALARALADAPKGTLVSLMLANNETGVIQPVAEAARLAHESGALIHTDAVQALGKIPVDLNALGVDLISVAAHKLGGPQGVGALIANDVEVTPRLVGGAQERVRRAGTENLAGIAGFAAACKQIGNGADTQILRDRLEAAIVKDAPEAVIFGTSAPRLPNTSLIALPDFASESQVIALDLAGVAVSSGAACSSGKVHTSRVLEAMGAGALSNCAIRVSLGWASTDDDITQFLTAWFDMRARRKARDRHAAVAA